MKEKLPIRIILLLFIILSGVAIAGYENIFLIIAMIGFTVLSFIVLLFTGLYDLLRKTRVSVIPLGIFCSFLLVVGAHFIITSHLNKMKMARAESLVGVIEEYNIKYGRYPERTDLEGQMDNHLFIIKIT